MSQSQASTAARTPNEIWTQDWLPKVKKIPSLQWEHIPMLRDQPPDEVLNFYEDLRLRSLKAPGGSDSDIMPEALFRLDIPLSSFLRQSRARPSIREIYKNSSNTSWGPLSLRSLPTIKVGREELCFQMARNMWCESTAATIDHTGKSEGRTAADAIELLKELSQNDEVTARVRKLGWRCFDDLKKMSDVELADHLANRYGVKPKSSNLDVRGMRELVARYKAKDFNSPLSKPTDFFAPEDLLSEEQMEASRSYA